MSLSQDRLKEILDYDKETGIFTWLLSKGRAKSGDVAGTHQKSGYIQIQIDGINYKAHRLAFLFVVGFLPENYVDHYDRCPSNNIWSNLREVSQQCNLRNSKVSCNNTSGVTGVSWNKACGKWQAYIVIDNKLKHQGYFKNLDDAARARWEAEIKYGFPNCNSTSSAYNYLIENNLTS